MNNNTIHIVSFDVPYPDDYGGVIDVYNRCKALKKNGVNIILHCFEYGRGRQKKLNEVASKIYYYKRSKNPFLLFFKTPFIVLSRKNKKLLNRLCKDEFPILFEGHHTCAFISAKDLSKRLKLVRVHNIEHEYYKELAKVEKNYIKKLFFKIEAKKLALFEKQLAFCDTILSISLKEQKYYQRKFGNSEYISAFSPSNFSPYTSNKKKYFLFHGNLSVSENEKVCDYLIQEIFYNSEKKLIIAGKNPNQRLKNKIARLKNIELIDSPSNKKLNQLINQAKANLLFTFQNTGIKLKLLNALMNGGYCIANDEMLEGSGLKNLCIVANTPDEIQKKITFCLKNNFTIENYNKRINMLQTHFDSNKNAKKIIRIIDNET